MDDQAPNSRAGQPSAAGRPAPRRSRPDRATVPAAAASDKRPLVIVQTPLVPSRSLGPLLGLRSLQLKLESCQPGGSWLDRGAARVVGGDQTAARTLGAIGGGPVSAALAIQSARAGRPLVVLMPIHDAAAAGWLEALGARVILADADEATLRQVGPSILAGGDIQHVGPADSDLLAGLADALAELNEARGRDDLLVLPSLTGTEAPWLVAQATDGEAAIRLPLDEFGVPDAARIEGIVGELGEAGGRMSAGRVDQWAVTGREARAAQRLLAREEGIVTSVAGAAGLAGLIRAIRADRLLPARARRLPREPQVMLVTARDPFGDGGPPLAADTPRGRAVTLAEIPEVLAALNHGIFNRASSLIERRSPCR